MLFVVSAVFVAVTAAIATGDLAWQALDDVAALQEDATWGIDRIDARSGLDGTFDDSKYTT